MKREEQKERMINRILESAVKEFSVYDYNAASINRICDRADISKGIIYHYFENKDHLYVRCAELCFHSIAAYSTDIRPENYGLQDGIVRYMKVRTQYFNENPEYKGLFFNAILRTPLHLRSEINKLKQEFDKNTLSFFREILSKNRINGNITTEDALSFLNIQLNMFYEYFQSGMAEERDMAVNMAVDMERVIEEYEKQVSVWLTIILYGLVKE